MLGSRIDSLDDLVDDIGTSERARAVRAVAAARFAVAGLYRADGAITMGSWLVHHARMSHADAARLLAEGRFLVRYLAVADALIAGDLYAAQAAMLRDAVTAPTAGLFDDHQGGVVTAIIGLDLVNTRVAVNRWRAKAEALVEMPEPKVRDRC